MDAENKDLFMRVLNISYPLTIENVKKDTCGVRIKLSFPATSHSGIEIKYGTDMMYLPAGYYTLEKLINVLNSYVSEYDIEFSILPSGRIGVVYSIQREYWFSDETIGVVGQKTPQLILETSPQNTDNGDELEIEITDTLKYILGMRAIVVHPLVTWGKNEMRKYVGLGYMTQAQFDTFNWYYFMNKINKLGEKTFACSYTGKSLPDISDGVDKMFIYCEQLEMSIVGDTYAHLLVMVPLKPKNRGNGSLCVYTPPDVRRKLIKSRINQFNIGLYDTTHTLIPFSSGTVNIECVIE